ncbi:cilia- and flagella-associated protein 251-like [Dicentrarchus labrax]|uniref:cilia- and flagella-associated protein 251-like n=1 Tax=Dicentrarchus labrax TaxID=13489 RepID=UPI0021F6985C|nr:cilia- and flagella-associated protein 251-like [Dicentrarchus labrax]
MAGKRHINVNTQAQHGVVPGRRADEVDQPFPNKPVSHRRPLNTRRQDTLDLNDFEKINITKEPKGSLSHQLHPSNVETTASQHPRKDPLRLPRGELQMAKAIYAKELMLQEKLWRVEEKIRQKIQTDYGDVQKSEEERHSRGQAPTKTRMSELQRREPMRNREMIKQEKRQEDVKQLRKRQDQRNEDRMRNTHEEEGVRLARREPEVAQSPQSQRKGRKGTDEIIVRGEEVSGELNKSRWENVKERTRIKAEDEKDNSIWGGVKAEKQIKPENNTTSMGDKVWTREKKYMERTCKEIYGSDEEEDLPQTSQQKTSHRAATENHRGEGRNLSEEPLLPPFSSPSLSSRPEQGELDLKDSTYDGLQLLPCRTCNRKFAHKRLETHVQICKKVKQSHRQVFNSYVNRTKGSAMEEFLKTHSRSKTPEVLKKKDRRQSHKANTRNLHQGHLPAGTTQPKRSK